MKQQEFQFLLKENTLKMSILGPKMQESRSRLSRYLEKYLEFLHFVKSSEISVTSSIRINKLSKKVSDPPIPLILEEK